MHCQAAGAGSHFIGLYFKLLMTKDSQSNAGLQLKIWNL
jgi:hypothetical protein